MPMSLKQVTMVSCAMQATWYSASGVSVNGWQAVTRLGELATAAVGTILTDKTGTLTVNRMITQVVARRLEPQQCCTRWAIFAQVTPAGARITSLDHVASCSPVWPLYRVPSSAA